ncbi:MAG: peptidylprolyl isomerase [Methylohalobius sp. ZOD2]|nr:peptidyl-prolyl cis-trans isomerase [Methylothermaceae bacterium]
MKYRYMSFWALLLGILMPGQAQVLVTVGGHEITDAQLEQALKSSPFATRIPALGEDEQARLRGDLLRRLVHFEALLLEAERLGLDRTPGIQLELKTFEMGLLAQRYLQKLRDGIEVPVAQVQQWRQKFGTDLNALAAARALYVSRRYEAFKSDALADLEKRFGDLDETALWARAARSAGIDVEEQVGDYRRELLVQKLRETKEKEWVPDASVLRDYYRDHPAIGRVPERRRIGQIVVDSRELAERLRRRILAGESLFRLASKYSVDSYGREHAGDMGWLPAGIGMPPIEQALAALPDKTVSEVIETPRGFHLVMIVDRRPGEQKRFAAIEDRVRRAMLAEKFPDYVAQLLDRHSVRWQLSEIQFTE